MHISESIRDPGLQLAVLEQLLRAELLGPERLASTLQAAIAAVRAEVPAPEGGVYDVGRGGRERILRAAVGSLGGTPVTADELAGVKSLDFDGGNEIYLWLERELATGLGLEDWQLDTGGESELYLARTLDGVAALPALERLVLDAYGAPASIAPLAAHARVEELVLQSSVEDPEVLLSLPRLARVRVSKYAAFPAQILDELRGKGVEVTVR